MHVPSSTAREEFGAAWPELKRRLGLDPDRVGVLGRSIGTAAAELVWPRRS